MRCDERMGAPAGAIPRSGRGTWVATLAVAAILSAVAFASEGAAAGAASPRARIAILDERIVAALESPRAAEAGALLDSTIALRGRALGAKPMALAASIDSLGLRLFGTGSHAGWDLAIRCFERSLAVKERALGARDLEVARTLSALGALNDYLGRWDAALPRARRALEIRLERNGPRDPLVASSLRQVGMDHFELGEYAAADSLLARALSTYRSLEGDHHERIADALNNLGEIARVRDRLDRSEASFREGLEVARAHLAEDAPLRVALMNNLAGLFKDMARYDEAEPLLIESLRLRESAAEPDSMAIATGHLNLAEVLRLQERLDEAEPHYARALALARSILGPDHPELAPFVNQAAALYLELEDGERAEALLRESLASAERALGPDHPVVAQGLDDLARALLARGAVAAADSALGRALAIREERLGADHPDVAVARIHRARARARREDAGRAALADLDPALAVLENTRTHPEERLDAYAQRSELRERARDVRGALADLSTALETVDSLRTRRGGGEFSRAALLARHLDLYHRSVRLRVAAGDPAGAWEAHERGRARILLDQLAASGLDPRSGVPPEELAPLLDQESRARARLARVQSELQSAAASPSASEVERLERVAALESARDSAAWDVQRALEQMRERSPLWRRTLTSNGRPAAIEDVARALGRDEALLEYHVGADASYAFLVEGRGGAPRVAPLAIEAGDAEILGVDPGPLGAESLERIVAGAGSGPLRRAGIAALLGRPPLGLRPGASEPALEERLEALRRVLVPRPIADRIARARRAVVVPDGALHLLPFEALVTRRGRDGIRYWLDDGPALRYAASATSLLELERRRASNTAARTGAMTVLSVCDPRFPGSEAAPDSASERGGSSAATRAASERDATPIEDVTARLRGAGPWAPLPGTRRETRAIVAAFAPLPIDTLAGAAASEPAVRAALPSHRLIHLATHGFVTERRGDVLGGLVLAESAARSADTGADGFLQLFEIYAIPLDADLVVLSACETARGPRVAGEGVFALSRGFQAAGAHRVIASLWPVNDASTAELMSELFGRLARGARSGKPLDYVTLARDARRALRARPGFEAPFHWAPFVLSGVK